MKFIMLFVGMLLSLSTVAEPYEPFNLMELPKGKTLMLPRPAWTKVPLGESVQLSSTGRNQAIKMSVSQPQQLEAVSVTIYDPLSDRPQQLKIAPNSSAIYNFHGLRTIRILSRDTKKLAGTSLLIESNQPLEISR